MRKKEGIAIIGVGCRFPGGVNDLQSLWKLLAEGREAIGEVPADRWNIERFYDAEPGLAGRSVTRRGAFLNEIDQFDPSFFGISPREAPYVDPQHRLLLETAWEAIENGGIVLDLERGTDLAVFVGISHNDYQGIQGTPWDHSGISAYSPTGCAHSIAANRISYCLNLRGPSVAIDTACSSALTAVYLACEHIWAGRGDAALAGAVTVMITPNGFIGFSQASMLSSDGQCSAFDASANGFVRGEGAGMVLLKRLSRALADGDPIQAVIMGTAMNQDGHTNGISLPSLEAEARLVRDACADAGISPSQIGYVEAHGTGTAVGDPIEAHALSEALCASRSAEAPLLIGSVKTNLGHLETAAGLAGLLKAMLVIKHGQIPASLHFKTPNPRIDFAALKLRVPTRLEPFPQTDGTRIVGVSSAGFGGANSHVIIAEARLPFRRPQLSDLDCSGSHLQRAWPLVLSARSEKALQASATRLAALLDERSKANGSSPILPDLTYTLGARRNHHPHRLTMVARSIEDAIQELNDHGAGHSSPRTHTAFTPRREQAPRVAFVMSGQGPQWWGMGRELMQHEPVFRRTIERCDLAMRPWWRFSLLEELGRPEESSLMHRTGIAQPAIFAMQMGFVDLWKSWGVFPAAVVGHSVGEVAAACVAGVLTLEQAARVIVLRGQFMDDCARGQGTMLAVGAAEDEARVLAARHDRTVTIAAFNSPRSVTLAGPRASLEAIAAELDAQGTNAQLVRVDYPFHHPLMQPASRALEAALADLKPQPERLPLFSTVTGQRHSGEACDAAYWGRGVRQPVEFASAVNELVDLGVDVWLEINVHPALARSIQECLTARSCQAPVMSSARREHEHESTLETAMHLHRFGVSLDFAAMTPSRCLLSLPAYAWDKSRWWRESSEWLEGRLAPGGRGLLDVRLPRATPTWIARLDGRHMAYLKDHKVENRVLFPAAAFVEMVLEAGVQWFEGRPFVLEDFEIRKPLILPEPASGIELELSYDPNERTFLIHSRFENGAAWSLHVVGSMRGERTGSGFALSNWADSQPHGLNSVELDEFYRHMGNRGLRYGQEFQPIRELSAGAGKSASRVSLSEAIASRASEYSVHPVLFDGALQTFSAAAATTEDRNSSLKLPVRFSRIAFLHSPGSCGRVRAHVQHCKAELVDGRIELYDEDGNPSLLIDGFRAISVAESRRIDTSGQSRDVVYHVAWERAAASSRHVNQQPVPLDSLQAAARHALDDVIGARGRTRLQTAIAALDELAAVQLARGLREMAVEAGSNGTLTAESLHVAEPMRPVFQRLVTGLVKNKLLEDHETEYQPTPAFVNAADSAQRILRSFISKYPGYLSEGLLCAGNCSRLGALLRGEQDAVEVLFGGAGPELLDQFYGEGLLTSHWLAAITATVQEAARQLPEGRGLRILEVGAGTAGLTAHVLPLLERVLHSYTFTDVSAAFFPGATQKLAAFPEVEYKILDLERPGPEQGFEANAFDFVIATNVLHAVNDVRTALRHIYELLVPGGNLVFTDLATAQLWTETVFGLTSGWRRFTDRDLRKDHPLLARAQWETILRETGFNETAFLSGLLNPEGREGQFCLLARKSCQESKATESPTEMFTEMPKEKSWLIFGDESGLGDRLASRLRGTGLRCRVAHRGNEFVLAGADTFRLRNGQLEDFQHLLEICTSDSPPERLVYLWTLDEPVPTVNGVAPLMGTAELLKLVRAIEITNSGASLRIDLITRGAQPVGQVLNRLAVEQAPALGLLRVILSELPNLSCRGIDLPPVTSSSEDALLWSELLREDSEREVALRGEARYVQRLARGRPSNERLLDIEMPLRLESRSRGQLDALRFVPFAAPICGAGDVLIEVKAAGLNFRDVLKALALYPGEAPDARFYGDEVAGIVKAVGDEVKHVSPGDKVFGLAVFGLATHALARAADIRRIPRGLSFEEAVTLPVAFMTAWHALETVARLRAGERILVHAGAGGVGMAAIQIANYLGADVIATAGSPTKRALIGTLGVKHVIDSRHGDFADAVMELTEGRGVDVVLNSLAAEAIPMGLSCLAEFGRFIEIGKRDIYQNARIPLRPMRHNASFHVIAMDAVFAGDKQMTRQMLENLCALVERGTLCPLPFRSFPASRIDSAFRLMAQAKHIGKVVVAFPESFVLRRGEPLAQPFEIRPDGCYLITGAFGGFGKVIARWLVERGARHLVLTSRNRATSSEAEAFAHSLRDRGAEVRVVQADVCLGADVTRLIAECCSGSLALRGIFHLAMVIDDAPLSALTPDRMREVMAPKAYGAWLLHEYTRHMELDCFVMFSSVSSIFGNPGQGNYSAANAFLDSLAHHRHAAGLPALTVNWGVLGEEGYVARNERVAEYLTRQGMIGLSPGEVTALLESFLKASVTQAIAIRVDWAKWGQFFRRLQQNPLLEHIMSSTLDREVQGATSDWRLKIESASPDEREAIIGQAVREIVASVLRMKPDGLRNDHALADLGLDSLMGVEIENSLEMSLGVALPPTSLLRARTIGGVATLIAEQLHLKSAGGSHSQTVVAPDEARIDEVDLQALSEADIDRLFGNSADSTQNLKSAQ
jgi:acyl transferase domain-containing protein/NADPH:quinone reductase-like Zn-dependent oxidoreductase/NAD(P)-dependent dehydrogenase (short-subunit alcohol dehydrogenase family)/acyl carrier protein